MTLTLLDIYNECAGQPWSMFDAEAESADDFESALKISINKAISYLWNYQPWTFRLESTTFKTRAGKTEYSVPNGKILVRTNSGVEKYGVTYDNTYLDYSDNIDYTDEEEGEPTTFYVEGETLYIYPIPDDSYTITVQYYVLPFGTNDDNDDLYELTNDDDYIDIPEKYETLFKNCLISLAMMYAIAEETDENYSSYQKQYEDALDILIDYCNTNIKERTIGW